MSRDECRVCGGRRVVTLRLLPTWEELQLTVGNDAISPDAKEFSKDFPCPECAKSAPEGNVKLIEYHAEISSHQELIEGDPKYLDHMKREVATLIGHAVAGHIVFQKGDYDEFRMTQPLRGTLGVTTKAHVASMEERIEARQMELAEEVMNVARIGIAGQSEMMERRVALQAIEAALPLVIEKRKMVKV